MKKLIWLLKWILKAAIFFTLFAFALNNQQETTVHFFFGTEWKTSMVIIVLAVFTAGLAVGVLGMVPRWWKHRHAVTKIKRQAAAASTPAQVGLSEKSQTPSANAPTDYPL
ncbi:MAG: LapA family protein [Burkholderiaceae bacterium]|nr:LapA family protein [Burkholderiaceae bacterium]